MRWQRWRGRGCRGRHGPGRVRLPLQRRCGVVERHRVLWFTASRGRVLERHRAAGLASGDRLLTHRRQVLECHRAARIHPRYRQRTGWADPWYRHRAGRPDTRHGYRTGRTDPRYRHRTGRPDPRYGHRTGRTQPRYRHRARRTDPRCGRSGCGHIRQRAHEVIGALEARLGLLGDRAHHGVHEWLRNIATVDRRRLRQIVHMGVQDTVLGLAAGIERRLPAQELVERDPEGVHVGAAIDSATEDLLGRHVQWAADAGAGLGCAHRALPLGNAEIHHLDDVVPGDHQVGRLEIAMDDAGAMRSRDPAQRLFEERDTLVRRDRPPPPDQLLQALAVDELHHGDGCAVVHEVVEQQRDVRVIEGGLQARFLTEALDEVRVVARLGAHHLDRDRPVEIQVERLVNDAHRAATDEFQNAIVV